MGRHADLMTEWFETVWNQNDPSFIYKVCDEKMITKGHRGREIRGPEDFEQFHAMICSLVDDIQMEVIKCVEDGDWASLVYSFKAKRKDNGETVGMTGSTMIRFDNGKVVEVYEHPDFITLFEEMELFPRNALETCLCGEALH